MAHTLEPYGAMQVNRAEMSPVLRLLNKLFAELRYQRLPDGMDTGDWAELAAVWESWVEHEGERMSRPTAPKQVVEMNFCVSAMLEKFRRALADEAEAGEPGVLALNLPKLEGIFDRLLNASRDKCWRMLKTGVGRVDMGENPPDV